MLAASAGLANERAVVIIATGGVSTEALAQLGARIRFRLRWIALSPTPRGKQRGSIGPLQEQPPGRRIGETRRALLHAPGGRSEDLIGTRVAHSPEHVVTIQGWRRGIGEARAIGGEQLLDEGAGAI
jgi:hypothetical protein